MNGRYIVRSPRRGSTAKAATPTPIVAVGATIESRCKKCKKATSHRVARMLGVRPTLVECLVCSEAHDYRSPAVLARAARRRAEVLPPAATPEEAWTRAMKRAGGASVAYSSAAYFPIGQRLSHSLFGDGVVTSRGSSTVCTVVFQTGEKRLLMGSPARLSEGDSTS